MKPAVSHLPLYADDDELGAALLGKARVKEWKSLAPALERKGLPRIDGLMGGRFVPAVIQWFYQQNGLLEQAADNEGWREWLPKQRGRRA